jgi:copper oxidase (laccase) domain-containing protein
VAALAEHFGSRAGDLVAAIGPAISAERYEVGRDVRERFETAGFDRDRMMMWFPKQTREDHWLFDGWQAASDQLAAAGVAAARIHVARLCTATYPDLFCSYRRDGARAGRMAAVVKPT